MDGSFPPEIPRALVQELIKISATITKNEDQIQEASAGNPILGSIFELITGCVTRALSSVDKVSVNDHMPSKKRKFIDSAGEKKRGGFKRRGQTTSWRKVTVKTLDDGYTWRKYGQKDIQNDKNPRSYFRCTHKTDQGCMARRQVQALEEDPSTYVINYIGEHTCKDLANTVPQLSDCSNYDNKDSWVINFETNSIMQAPMPQSTAIPSFKDDSAHVDEEVLSSNLTTNSSSAAYNQHGLVHNLRYMPDQNGDITSCFQFPDDNLDMDYIPYHFDQFENHYFDIFG